MMFAIRRDKQDLLIDRSRRVLLIINPTLQGPTLRRQGCAPCFSQPSISARETNYPKQVFYFHRGLRFSRNAVWDGVWQNGFTLIGRDVIVRTYALRTFPATDSINLITRAKHFSRSLDTLNLKNMGYADNSREYAETPK